MKKLFALHQGGSICAPQQIMVRLLLLLVVVIVVDILTTSRAMAQPVLPLPNHVVIVIEENRAYSDIIGSPNASYINALAQSGALFVNSFAITHPSEPNYLALFSGSTQGVTDDSCPHTFYGPNLGGELLKAGLSFGGYSETMPNVGYPGCQSASLYARKHNPWVNFTDVPPGDNLPWTSFPTSYDALPTISIVVPNLQHDMHDGTVQQGDIWLQQHMDSYVQWAKTHNSLLIVTWDEDNGTAVDHIPTFVVGPMVKPGRYNETITHYSMLRTLEGMYGLPYANRSAAFPPISSCWQG